MPMQKQHTPRVIRQDVGLDPLAGVAQQDRPALAVGGEVQADRGVGDPELLGDDVALEEAALAAAVAPGPGHADPAPRADLAAEPGVERAERGAAPRIERAGRDLVGEELPDLAAQRLRRLGQPHLVEVDRVGNGVAHRAASIGHSASAPRAATQLPSRAAHAVSLPWSSRHAHSLRVKRCSGCSVENPIAPWTWWAIAAPAAAASPHRILALATSSSVPSQSSSPNAGTAGAARATAVASASAAEPDAASAAAASPA